jgi:DNA-binding CsgD family transcriptional regulator
VARVRAERACRRDDVVEELTARQREVLGLLADGKSLKEVAAGLGISVKTVEFHKYRIMNLLGIRTNAEMTKYAVKRGVSPL